MCSVDVLPGTGFDLTSAGLALQEQGWRWKGAMSNHSEAI